ncbi:dihydroorotase [Chitinophaga lutea]
MQILIKSVKIVAPQSPFHGQIQDILVENGVIANIGSGIAAEGATVIEGKNLHAGPGWMDVFAQFCDPGQEYKEDLRSGASAAARGGFTTVMVVPNTQPAIHTKTQVEYILSQSRYGAVSVLPIGAISKNLEGASLAEMYEMRQTGAVAFSDGLKPVQASGILLKALQYVKAFDGTVIQIPDDQSISGHGLMNEGVQSTRLGMAGKPAIAEEIMLRRDIELARYTESRIHFTGISTRRSVELIAAAKAQGVQVTCSVTPYHLLFTDGDLSGYNSFLKVNPPLRTEDDVQALKDAIRDGVVDCFATHHQPQDWDAKEVEFEYAKPGMIGLESAFGALRIALPDVGIDRLTDMLSTAPRRIFHLPEATVEVGATADITVFEPDERYIFSEQHIASKSRNTPFLGKELKGSAKAIVRHKQFILHP